MGVFPRASAATRRQSADEWRRLNGTNGALPRVVVHRNEVRFYFPSEPRPVGFVAKLGRARLPTSGFQVSSALLRLKPNFPLVQAGMDGWREPVLIAGAEWRELSTNLLAGLTPATPGHAKYYRGLLGEQLLYRDASGRPASVPVSQPPPHVIVDHRYSIEESLQIFASLAEPLLLRAHPDRSLFVLMVHPARSPQPLLIDTRRRRCVWMSSAALYESMEPAFPLAPTLRSLSALILESNGLALLKNPVSSAGRLGNMLVTLCVNVARLPLPKPSGPVPPLAHQPGMDLPQWEEWLDHHTGTYRENGTLQLLIDGERFFPRFQQAVSNATDHIKVHVFIFDNDDVAVDLAKELKWKSQQVSTEVILDRMASITAARIAPVTPPPKSYVPPVSISAYLKSGSKVQVRPFLNSFCSFDHSKIYLIDGTRAWMGGMNIGREYRSEWHDMMFELRGPIVSSLEYQYQLDWAHAGWLGDLGYLKALLTLPKPAPPPPGTNDAWIQIRRLPTTTLRKPFAKAVLTAMGKASSYIYVENPYLFDKRVMSALVRARARGVDVRVILPHVNDSQTGARAELIAANYLVSNGVRIFYYPGMSHVKAVLVDGWACIGSGNLNEFSFRLCQESNIGTSDPAFAARLKHDLFEEDFARSYELTEPVTVEWMDFVADFLLEGI